jgi:hypothetical protein
MSKRPNKPLVNILMSHEDLAELDEWRHNNRFAARAEAMRFLMKLAMRTKPRISPEDRRELAS